MLVTFPQLLRSQTLSDFSRSGCDVRDCNLVGYIVFLDDHSAQAQLRQATIALASSGRTNVGNCLYNGRIVCDGGQSMRSDVNTKPM
jgi:hypothetical protein